MNSSHINYPLLVIIPALSAVLFIIGWQRIEIDMDVVSSLPQNDPVIRDAMDIFLNHPFQDQVTIDVWADTNDPDQLIACAKAVEKALRESDLFKSVGMESVLKGLPQLMQTVVESLPVLFTAEELKERMEPLLSSEKITGKIQALKQGLFQIDSIGKSAFLAQDPLGFKDIVLAKLLFLAPTQTARIYKGYLISQDRRHLLITAVPVTSGTDTLFARKLSYFMTKLNRNIQQRFTTQHLDVRLTPIGAYRAALDNEMIVRADVQKMLLISFLGIAVLLLFTFPRPLLGLLSLLPAIVGTLTAFFVFALLRPSISILVLGFGGAVISITVDHGIAYLLFLDRPSQTFGKDAAREVRAVGLLAALTTMGAFGTLMLSGFSVFGQLGLFTSLGICFSFLFVHLVFPKIFPSMPAAKKRWLPLPKIADGFFSFGTKGIITATVFFVSMLFFIKPGFNVNLSTMNTVGKATQAAEEKLTTVWGDVFSKVFLMTEADSIAGLQTKNDHLLAKMESDDNDELLKQAFVPSMLFPGKARREANLAAWNSFWTTSRIVRLKQRLLSVARESGFRDDAFEPFFTCLEHPEDRLPPAGIPEQFQGIMGISRGNSDLKWRQFASLILPNDYQGIRFYDRYAKLARIFEPDLFSSQLGQLLVTTFLKLFVIIGPAVVILLLLFFLDIELTMITLAPVIFAMVCTLGTLSIIGRSLDIPGLMLAVIILGIGIDYSLFMVRSYQRYGEANHPSFYLIRSAVVIAAASTLVGFGVLALADHALLQSVGITSLLAISYSVLGAFLILPPLLKRKFETPPKSLKEPTTILKRVLWRYRSIEPYARIFARFKIKLDPMFSQLPKVVKFNTSPQHLLDLGTGYGVPACWIVESYPSTKIYGIEPAVDRVRVAKKALGDDGIVVYGQAPDLPPSPDEIDGAFMLDMIHFLTDDQLVLTLNRLYSKLSGGALLVIRTAMESKCQISIYWRIDLLINKIRGFKTFFRSCEKVKELLSKTGFKVQKIAVCGRNSDLMWICAVKIDEETFL
jgi:predicted exporter/ubiquinone/menaquinone biosynthesis C-methylase UbiE